ncbi:hypothetical protein KEM55_008365, partial [Ascosphaera atra]
PRSDLSIHSFALGFKSVDNGVGEGKDDAVDGDDSASASASAVDVTKDSAQYQPTTHEPKRKVSRLATPKDCSRCIILTTITLDSDTDTGKITCQDSN